MSIGGSSEEITTLLKAWSSGDEAALKRFAEHLFPELRLTARCYIKSESLGAARARDAHKRGGGALNVNLDETALLSKAPNPSILALDDAVLEISPRTVKRDWNLARACRELSYKSERITAHDPGASPAA